MQTKVHNDLSKISLQTLIKINGIFFLDKGWGFGPVVVFAIGHRQEKGITVTLSQQQGLPCPKPQTLPSL